MAFCVCAAQYFHSFDIVNILKQVFENCLQKESCRKSEISMFHFKEQKISGTGVNIIYKPRCQAEKVFPEQKRDNANKIMQSLKAVTMKPSP